MIIGRNTSVIKDPINEPSLNAWLLSEYNLVGRITAASRPCILSSGGKPAAYDKLIPTFDMSVIDSSLENLVEDLSVSLDHTMLPWRFNRGNPCVDIEAAAPFLELTQKFRPFVNANTRRDAGPSTPVLVKGLSCSV